MKPPPESATPLLLLAAVLAEAEPAAIGLAAGCATSSLSEAFGHARRAPRGVRRFRSVADADAHHRRWESAQEDIATTAEQQRPTDVTDL